MTKHTQKSLLALMLAAATTLPLAIAQTTSPATAANQAPASHSNDISTVVTSQTPSPTASTAQKSWSELDSNKDGNLSKAEAAGDAGMNAIFAKADTNHDGILTPDEYRAYYDKYMARSH